MENKKNKIITPLTTRKTSDDLKTLPSDVVTRDVVKLTNVIPTPYEYDTEIFEYKGTLITCKNGGVLTPTTIKMFLDLAEISLLEKNRTVTVKKTYLFGEFHKNAKQILINKKKLDNLLDLFFWDGTKGYRRINFFTSGDYEDNGTTVTVSFSPEIYEMFIKSGKIEFNNTVFNIGYPSIIYVLGNNYKLNSKKNKLDKDNCIRFSIKYLLELTGELEKFKKYKHKRNFIDRYIQKLKKIFFEDDSFYLKDFLYKGKTQFTYETDEEGKIIENTPPLIIYEGDIKDFINCELLYRSNINTDDVINKTKKRFEKIVNEQKKKKKK